MAATTSVNRRLGLRLFKSLQKKCRLFDSSVSLKTLLATRFEPATSVRKGQASGPPPAAVEGVQGGSGGDELKLTLHVDTLSMEIWPYLLRQGPRRTSQYYLPPSPGAPRTRIWELRDGEGIEVAALYDNSSLQDLCP